MRKNCAQNRKSGESCGRARSSPVSPHTNERHMPVYLLTFSQAKLYNLSRDEKGNCEDRFLRFILLLLCFWEASQGTEQNRTVRVRAWIKRKKEGNVDGGRERKGRAYLLEIGNNSTRLSISRVDDIKTKGTITFFLVNNGEAKDCPCEGREDKHNKVNKNNPSDSFGQPFEVTAGSDTRYVAIRFSPPPQNSKLDLGIRVQGSLAYPRPY